MIHSFFATVATSDSISLRSFTASSFESSEKSVSFNHHRFIYGGVFAIVALILSAIVIVLTFHVLSS